MKRIVFPIIIFALLAACEETIPGLKLKPDTIDTTLIDTSYIAANLETPQQRMVLVEDFTGVKCPNCPAGAQKIHDIDSICPDRIVAIAQHVNNIFGIPFKESKDTFRNEASTFIFNMLGKGSQPTGSIDRIKYPGETKVTVSLNQWLNYTQQRLTVTPNVNVHLESEFDPTDSSSVKFKVKIHFLSNLADTIYLSVGITESKIIDLQQYPNGVVDTYYVHNHVLRQMLTSPGGDLLIENPEQKREIIKEFRASLPQKYNLTNCNIVAFVHKSSSSYEVLQSAQIPLK